MGIEDDNDSRLLSRAASIRQQLTIKHVRASARTPESRTRFFEILQQGGGVLTDEFVVDSSGGLGERKRTYTGAGEMPDSLGLSNFAKPTGLSDKSVPLWLPQDLREAADWVNDLFPDIKFDFSEYEKKKSEHEWEKVFAYTARYQRATDAKQVIWTPSSS